jgi:SAM-dependent MidA family methyltransferase
VIEVGAGDGTLAQSIAYACGQMNSGLAQALYYVTTDYAPRWPSSSSHHRNRDHISGDPVSASDSAPNVVIQPVKADGIGAFRNVVGCILSNELIDNFPVHRFAIRGGRVMEVFVTLSGENFTEVLDEPSSARIEPRITSLGVSLPEGYRGEVNLAMEDWMCQISRALDRGFILTIDYGQEAADLYSAENKRDTLVCYHRHAVREDPYQNIGQQDITCHVDFTSLMRLGESHGLTTVGYTSQSQFLTNLGFSSLLDALDTQGQSAARTALSRMAMMALVDPEDYGDLKVLAQAKVDGLHTELLGFAKERL